MKDLRFVTLLPFSVGCVSQSSVAVMENAAKGAVESADTAAALRLTSGEDGRPSIVKRRSASFSGAPLTSFSKPNVAAGFHKLIRGFRSLSQQFLVYGEDDEEEEMEMVIGFPTDVQHVGHIGWDSFDGTAGDSTSNMKSCWEKPPAVTEFLPLPSCSFSLQQFDLDLSPAQAAISAPPRGGGPVEICPQ